MNLRGKKISNCGEPFIIAEIGCNYDGNIEIAKKLILKAKEIGCDCAKFQSFDKDSLFTKSFYDNNAGDLPGETLAETLDRLTLTNSEIDDLISFCKKVDIGFASTPVSNVFVDTLASRDVEFIKIASFDLTNLPLLKYAASKGKPIILSVGLGTLQEIEEAVDAIFSTGNKDLALLHCSAAYPPKDEYINLRNIRLLRDYFGLPIGYSDHSKGYSVCLAAIAQGACIIEKHFTLDNTNETGDHPISANPEEMKIIVTEGKRIYTALGQYKRIISEQDEEYKNMLRRSVCTIKEFKKGDKITADALTFKRPGTGIQIHEVPYILNRTVKKDISADELLAWEDLEQ